jgi:UDP-N-acetylglucosamine 2-epimerase (non-hydrolysing)
MDEATVIMSGLEPNRVLEAVKLSVTQSSGSARFGRLIADYDTDNVSVKVLRIILSYTDYVNRTVWRK